MSYVLVDRQDDGVEVWIKQCESRGCDNLIYIQVSRRFCVKCLNVELREPLTATPIIEFEQERLM